MRIDPSTQYGLSATMLLREKLNLESSGQSPEESAIQSISLSKLEKSAFDNIERINSKIGIGEGGSPPPPPPP